MHFFSERLHLSAFIRLMRLHQPTGILLLFWPCCWSIGLAAPEITLSILPVLSIFALGSIVMRAAGCVVNDIWDRDFDRQVTRTKKRPLASGEISLRQALALLGVLLAIGLFLLLQLNTLTRILGVVSLPPVAVYPLMKRWINWPQAFLGLTFNWGALMGWTAIADGFAWPMLWLYLAGFFWTMAYDTIYALQDRADDIKAGIKSSAVALGGHLKIAVLGFFLLSLICLAIAGVLSYAGLAYFVAVMVTGIVFLLQVHTLALENPAAAMAEFKLNGLVGAVMFAGIILDKW